MDSIVATLTTLFTTLLGYIKQIATQFGLDAYLDTLLGSFGLGGEEETTI